MIFICCEFLLFANKNALPFLIPQDNNQRYESWDEKYNN